MGPGPAAAATRMKAGRLDAHLNMDCPHKSQGDNHGQGRQENPQGAQRMFIPALSELF